ncbi:hypothetical protein [Kitasatospora brasiliensis]|uniref:hypothetical protein n=1 Tax=Kitasatospora brasiliensis TaxID=3058040 RepID=UPI00293127ED|nr:hypothetical protein [Kitasatospora sp. K002]
MEIRNWLKKPPRLIRNTFHTIDDAVAWMAGELEQHPFPDSYGTSNQTRLAHLRQTLGQTAGSDIAWGWYPNTSQYVSYAIITCPHPHHHQPPCPQNP